MPEPAINEMAPRQRRRILALALLRAFLTATVLVALYYFIPLDEEWRASLQPCGQSWGSPCSSPC